MTLPDRAGRRTEQKGPRRLGRVGTLPHAGCEASSRLFPFRIRLSIVPPAGRAVARCPSDSRRALRDPPCRCSCRAYSRSIHPENARSALECGSLLPLLPQTTLLAICPLVVPWQVTERASSQNQSGSKLSHSRAV